MKCVILPCDTIYTLKYRLRNKKCDNEENETIVKQVIVKLFVKRLISIFTTKFLLQKQLELNKTRQES